MDGGNRDWGRAGFKGGQNLNPEKIQFRESRDSEKNPVACPIMVAFDVTGSMGFIPKYFSDEALGAMVGHILQRQPVPDPHMLFMGIGDCTQHDRVPCQATQFEADNIICDQITDIILEGGGGGNHFESYDLAWAFAALRTQTDQWDKRKAKGYLFTIGDEEFPAHCGKAYYKSIFGQDCPQEPTPEAMLKLAEERYHVFHIIIAEGSYASRNVKVVEDCWRQRLQRRALTLHDHRHVAELIVSAIAIENGTDPEKVISWWGGEQQATVRAALRVDELATV
jgi:hypothetical protein